MNKLFFVFWIVVLPQITQAKPTAVLPDDKIVEINERIMIDGSSSFGKEEEDSLIYRWSIDISPEGFNSQIDNPANPSISFTADTEGFYLIRLIVNDGSENSNPAYMVIRVENN